jgi:uncharacterized protein YprB with RNaseH-like and TPR domain
MDLKKRIDALNRTPMPEHEPSEAEVDGIRRRLSKMRAEDEQRGPSAIQFRRDVPRAQPPPRPRRRFANDPVVHLEEETDGTERIIPGCGNAYVVEKSFDTSCETWGPLCSAFAERLARADSPLCRHIASVCGGASVCPQDVLFMDLESTGLAGSPLFLIGTMTWEGDGLVVRQFFARDYSEEGAVISHFVRVGCGKKLLVSFNGKSFDVPYVRVRAAAVGVPFQLDAEHFDLLHVCRRIWRGVLPNCRLQTLERRICGRHRHSDIPGSEIPEAYHEYVRTGNAVDMLDVLAHNQQDLLTLAELMVKLPPPDAP